jgi:uncharacterized protein YodC (DUF2158 family)
MDYKVGDVVILKSGGPNMTIEKIGPIGFYKKELGAHCCWFEEKQSKHDVFAFDTLKIVQDK